MIYRFHHIHLICKDLKEMIEFFVEVLGARLIAERKFGTADGASLNLHGITVNLRCARENEEICEDARHTCYGYNHVGLEVDDIEAAYEELSGRGFVFISAPKATGNVRFALFKGPEAITIELIQSVI